MNRSVWLLGLLCCGLWAETASVSGKWTVQSSIAGHENSQSCTFVQKEETLTGECTGNDRKVEIKGSVQGNKVTWSYKSEYEGQPLTVEYAGEIAEKKMKGSVNVPEYSVTGDFTAVQQLL